MIALWLACGILDVAVTGDQGFEYPHRRMITYSGARLPCVECGYRVMQYRHMDDGMVIATHSSNGRYWECRLNKVDNGKQAGKAEKSRG